jgi:hypothetical protein
MYYEYIIEIASEYYISKSSVISVIPLYLMSH